MKIASLCSLVLAALLTAPPALAEVDVSAFVGRDTFKEIKISPTGEFLAATVPREDRTGLIVLRRATGEVTASFALGRDTHVEDFVWVNDERVLMSMSEAFGMRDDVTDATRWAIEQGIADPERICIYGASYGAYAALVGVAREPDLYQCAVGYVGVYDLVRMHREDSRSARSTQTWLSDWIGDVDSLAGRSATDMAERIKVPVFLAGGGE